MGHGPGRDLHQPDGTPPGEFALALPICMQCMVAVSGDHQQAGSITLTHALHAYNPGMIDR